MPVISTGDKFGTVPVEIEGKEFPADLIVQSWKIVNGQVELTLAVRLVVEQAEGQVP